MLSPSEVPSDRPQPLLQHVRVSNYEQVTNLSGNLPSRLGYIKPRHDDSNSHTLILWGIMLLSHENPRCRIDISISIYYCMVFPRMVITGVYQRCAACTSGARL